MPPPKNNLEEVLGMQTKGGSVQQVSVNSSTKKLKFKPSLSNASAGPSSTSTSLPTFSTPGFGKPRTATQPRNATALKSSTINNRREIMDISSESTSSSPTGSVKRTSSDPSLDVAPVQAAKRVKSNSVAEKENLANRPPRSPHKHVSITAPVGRPMAEDEPWRNMVPDPEPNPFKRLARDFPQFDRPASAPRSIPSLAPAPITVPGIPVSERDAELMKKSASDLQKLQVANHEISEYISDLAFKSQRNESTTIDMDLVDQIRTLVRDRNASIKRVIALKESGSSLAPLGRQGNTSSLPAHFQPTETLPPQSPYFGGSSSTFPSVGRSISEDRMVPEQAWTSTQSAASSRTISEPIEIDDDDDDYDNYPQNPASDDLWAHMEDVPMDIEHRTTTAIATKAVLSVANTQAATPLDREITKALQSVFKLTTFRHNQREAIVATLSGQDVFVLMPTGGGKSLCYQLPAVCKLGKTQGVTLVISPLISLMKDQVQALQEKRVEVLLWNAETSPSEAKSRMLAEAKPSLVYVTPEKLKDSNQAQDVINTLYSRKQLARFVIDEAHCISTWGQDFREAYQGLSSLRERYPTVPIMALTATATKNTIADIRTQLKLTDKCAFFKQSFNRPNLRYVIEPKKKTVVDQMIEFITATHPNKSGVIYCLARKDCETVSGKLAEKGLKVHYYHAGMPTKEKDETLNNWQKGQIHIIVATIAFGMGIDKPDVRFVLHHCMPKTLDGYYQETGRAGRDGKPADCILYFSFGDYCRLFRMIKRPDANGVPPSPEAVDRQLAALRTVISYCNNVTECRRVQVLAHFDEQFDRKGCGFTIPGTKCDNCSSDAPISIEDVTEEANHALDLVENVEGQNDRLTLTMCREALRGRGVKHVNEPQYGKASRLSPELVDQMLQTLTVMEVLKVEPLENGTGYNTDYAFVGPGANAFRDDEMEVKIGWRQKPGTTGVKKTGQKKQKKGKGKPQPTTDFDPIETFQEDDLYDFGESAPSSGSASQTSAINHASSSSHKLPETPAPAHQQSSDNSGDSASILYNEMRKLCEEITRTERLKSEEDVFDDATLQYLSVTCPLDYQSFIEGLTLVATDTMPDTDAAIHAQSQYLKYGSRFMSLCQDHKSSSSISRPPDSETLRSRYTFQSAAASTSSVTVRKAQKFKASR